MFCAILIIESCNAPRNNPFDPMNPGYSFVTLEGSVQTYSLPYTGIAGVSVFWSASNSLVATNSSGSFKIDNIQPVNGKLIFQKSGYLSDTINVTWGSYKVLTYQVNLSSIPTLDSIQLYTVVINQFSLPGQTSQLVLTAKITDRDNAIDTVFVQNSQLGIKKPLGFDAVKKIYISTLSTQDMNITDIEQTIGLNFNIIAKDVFGSEYNLGSSSVTRVINSAALIKFPANDTTIGQNQTFTWQRYKAGYPFKYMIEIYTNDFANSQLVYTANNISSDSISYYLPTALTSRNYYWVIWVIDQFRNRSRSLPATFTVQ